MSIEFALSSMRHTYMRSIERHVEDKNIGNSDAIFHEYILNNKDPEEADYHYEWMYLEDLNEDTDNENLPHLL
ncbi:hypothetical protein PTIM40_65 [Cyanophage P-TIM40]|uniref:Uncharacterized protein n=1 Tax=Cyanophage P-TIM40 TaxID=1589733 RepID=A0A0C5ADV9_9CAUD|nr:hypothetical protein AU107_gp065 [Cyanophage P-TIM40]AJK27492.1 hypothetical protein PTIM40_65 [Cyanophage P-TIM40]